MRNNLDLYVTMGFCVIIFVLMTIFIYDVDATNNLGLVIPLLCFICGYIFNQSLVEIEVRAK